MEGDLGDEVRAEGASRDALVVGLLRAACEDVQPENVTILNQVENIPDWQQNQAAEILLLELLDSNTATSCHATTFMKQHSPQHSQNN